ncbi:MAG: exo-beta-N-acetylmuramidase NamZ family protein [Thermodesulfovibrionales bacterium]
MVRQHHIVRIGLDRLQGSWPRGLKDANIGLLVHPASVNSRLEHASSICLRLKKFRVSAFFGPQHGIRGETQDNMIEWAGFRDRTTGIPVYSLYGAVRQPDAAMLRQLDVMVIDLQDVGARYYTFIWTMALVMEACMKAGKAVVVLDRPNPINGLQIEGPMLNPEFRSFVGLYPLPVRHGMTIGEIACYLRDFFFPGLQLHIIRLKGWGRSMWFEETKLPWVLPSPNMPTPETALVYPGMCLLEGTTISEGRGTTRPFEIFGAPYIDPDRLVERLGSYGLPGLVFRPLSFIPTFQKHGGTLCGGAQLHVTDRQKFKPFLTAVAVLKAIHDLYPRQPLWKEPPYEYEERLLPFDILAGDDRLRKDIEAGLGLKAIEAGWKDGLAEFNKKVRKNYLLYP